MFKRPPLPTREDRVQARAARMTSMALAAAARPVPVRASMSGSTSGVAIEKENAVQHQGYMAAVRRLGYCMRCKRPCRPQFCHRDEGKGTGIKTDVRQGWPGCDGCHRFVGSSGNLPKPQRRAEEDRLAAETRAEVERRGWWPKRLARWSA